METFCSLLFVPAVLCSCIYIYKSVFYRQNIDINHYRLNISTDTERCLNPLEYPFLVVPKTFFAIEKFFPCYIGNLCTVIKVSEITQKCCASCIRNFAEMHNWKSLNEKLKNSRPLAVLQSSRLVILQQYYVSRMQQR